ncbi:MAG: VOC family protein [Candidatus Hodarchaeota archaeon]
MIILLNLDQMQIELIQVLIRETIHSKFLNKQGKDLHHLGFFIDDIENDLSRLENDGIKVLESEIILEEVKFTYLDT